MDEEPYRITDSKHEQRPNQNQFSLASLFKFMVGISFFLGMFVAVWLKAIVFALAGIFIFLCLLLLIYPAERRPY